jgi:hypothetical protein
LRKHFTVAQKLVQSGKSWNSKCFGKFFGLCMLPGSFGHFRKVEEIFHLGQIIFVHSGKIMTLKRFQAVWEFVCFGQITKVKKRFCCPHSRCSLTWKMRTKLEAVVNRRGLI